MNICGLVVHAQPERSGEVRTAIEALAGAEVHAQAPGSSLVVTIEDTAGANAAETVLQLHRLPGVLSAAIVYHNFEPAGGDRLPLLRRRLRSAGADTRPLRRLRCPSRRLSLVVR